MSVYIKGMEMPTSENVVILINPSGGVWMIGDMPNEDTYLVKAKAISVPDHGDLIDRNVLYAKAVEWEEQAMHLANTSPDARTFDKWSNILTERSAFKFDVADAPTIIPADKEK